ncbi:MAG: thioredoxin family protein [Luteolibacter sp.]|uniref:thioredoxin family protein n=1 Tax=Luteolibacter sp. TaxID=1962973 RepID=UPI0032670008
MKSLLRTGCTVAALYGCGFAFAGGEGWSSDFAGSKKLAEESKKDLLMDFTGSDWCGWCIKLNDEVFKHEPFKAGVKDSFVLVEVDSPKDKSKLSAEVQKQNPELVEKYAIQGYPTILLCDAGGRPYAATGYEAGGPEKYVEHLNVLRSQKGKRDEGLATAAKADGVEKAKALVSVLDAMKLDDKLVANFYGDLGEQIKAADPKDETGFAKKAAAKKRVEDFQTALQEFGQKQDFDGALVLVEKTIKEGGFETEDTLQIMMTRASILVQQRKYDEALKAIDEAKAVAPESPMIEGIDKFRERVEAMKNKPAGAAAKEDDAEEEEK